MGYWDTPRIGLWDRDIWISYNKKALQLCELNKDMEMYYVYVQKRINFPS